MLNCYASCHGYSSIWTIQLWFWDILLFNDSLGLVIFFEGGGGCNGCSVYCFCLSPHRSGRRRCHSIILLSSSSVIPSIHFFCNDLHPLSVLRSLPSRGQTSSFLSFPLFLSVSFFNLFFSCILNFSMASDHSPFDRRFLSWLDFLFALLPIFTLGQWKHGISFDFFLLFPLPPIPNASQTNISTLTAL